MPDAPPPPHKAEATPGQVGALLAGVLAAAKAALPQQGLDLLVWGASRLGDQATLRHLLANGGGCSWAPSKDDEGGLWGGYSCLRVASACGHEGAARELLASGLGVEEVRSDGGVAPLLLAAASEEGREGEAGQLLEAGAGVSKAKTGVSSPWIKPGLPEPLARVCFGLLLDGPSAARARLACAGFRDLVGLHRRSLEVIPTTLPPGSSTAPPARLWSAFPSLRDLTVRIDQGEGEGAPHREPVRSLVASLPQLRHLRALRVASSASEDRATKAANAAALAALPAALAEMPWLSELSLDGQFDLRGSPLLLAGSRLAKLSVASSGGALRSCADGPKGDRVPRGAHGPPERPAPGEHGEPGVQGGSLLVPFPPVPGARDAPGGP